jgi:hypothetical protein
VAAIPAEPQIRYAKAIRSRSWEAGRMMSALQSSACSDHMKSDHMGVALHDRCRAASRFHGPSPSGRPHAPGPPRNPLEPVVPGKHLVQYFVSSLVSARVRSHVFPESQGISRNAQNRPKTRKLITEETLTKYGFVIRSSRVRSPSASSGRSLCTVPKGHDTECLDQVQPKLTIATKHRHATGSIDS